MPREHSEKLLRGALILTPALFLSKVVGLFYKVPLLSIVGVGGMAHFLSAYHVYSLLFVLSAAGLPAALALQTAAVRVTGGRAAVRRVFFVSLAVFSALGFCGAAALFFFARPLAAALSQPGAAACLSAIAPALLLSAFCGGVRGYYQGRHNMIPTAVSEVTESVGKLAFGLMFAVLARRRGLDAPHVAAAAVLGITAGLFLSALFLGACLLLSALRAGRDRSPKTGSVPTRRQVLASLFRVALPITVSASVMSFLSLVDTLVIPSGLLRAGYTEGVALSLYSCYGNLAVPLYNLVPALLTPVSLSLAPLLSAAFARQDRAGALSAWGSAWRLVAFLALPAALGLSAFAGPVLTLIYRGQGEAVAVAAPLLSYLAVSVLPASFLTLTAAALQAAGHAGVPVAALSTGAGVKLLSEWLLLPRLGITAAPLSTLLCTVVVLIFELLYLSRLLSVLRPSVKQLLPPLFSAMPAVLGGALLYFALPGGEGRFFPALALTLLIYFPLSLRLGAAEREDLLTLPGGMWLCRLLPATERKEVHHDKRRKNGRFTAKGRIHRGGSAYNSRNSATAGRVPVGQGTDAQEHPRRSH